MTDMVVGERIARASNEGWLSWLMRATTRGSDEHKLVVTSGELRGVMSLLSASAPPVGDGWQPIETAPKDGTWVLGCWFLPDRAPLFGVVSWGVDPRGDCWAGSEEGWRENDSCVAGVTHWMPLPPPPAPVEKDPS